jgi:hypothetical protein
VTGRLTLVASSPSALKWDCRDRRSKCESRLARIHFIHPLSPHFFKHNTENPHILALTHTKLPA